MKLYFAPGACSSSDLISLYEANLSFDSEKVDLATKLTETGTDYLKVNAKGYVPALVLETGETLTENVAILDWIAQQDSELKPPTAMARSRLIEALLTFPPSCTSLFSRSSPARLKTTDRRLARRSPNG